MYELYVHHGKQVWVRVDLRGRHREHCLCYACERFKPGEPDNCKRAQRLYSLACELDMVFPVWECPEFACNASAGHVVGVSR
jgi:hypothetical protein